MKKQRYSKDKRRDNKKNTYIFFFLLVLMATVSVTFFINQNPSEQTTPQISQTHIAQKRTDKEIANIISSNNSKSLDELSKNYIIIKNTYKQNPNSTKLAEIRILRAGETKQISHYALSYKDEPILYFANDFNQDDIIKSITFYNTVSIGYKQIKYAFEWWDSVTGIKISEITSDSFDIKKNLFAGGTGTKSTPFFVANPRHLNNVRFATQCDSQTIPVRSHFRQIRDIDLKDAIGIGDVFTCNSLSNINRKHSPPYYNGGKCWIPIGSSPQNAFQGVYDGGQYEINNLKINGCAFNMQSCGGLFGYINGATLTNISLGRSTQCIGSMRYIGAICGENYRGTITNCSNRGDAQTDCISGGLCGFNNEGTILNCSNYSRIFSSKTAGGICGKNTGVIKYSYNMDYICSKASIGGICAENEGDIILCGNSGFDYKAISSNSSLSVSGGICGINKGNIDRCYNTGNFGSGICCLNQGTDKSVISNCFNTGYTPENGCGICLKNENPETVFINCVNAQMDPACLLCNKPGIDCRPASICENDSTNTAVFKNCFYLKHGSRAPTGKKESEIKMLNEDEMRNKKTVTIDGTTKYLNDWLGDAWEINSADDNDFGRNILKGYSVLKDVYVRHIIINAETR